MPRLVTTDLDRCGDGAVWTGQCLNKVSNKTRIFSACDLLPLPVCRMQQLFRYVLEIVSRDIHALPQSKRTIHLVIWILRHITRCIYLFVLKAEAKVQSENVTIISVIFTIGGNTHMPEPVALQRRAGKSRYRAHKMGKPSCGHMWHAWGAVSRPTPARTGVHRLERQNLDFETSSLDIKWGGIPLCTGRRHASWRIVCIANRHIVQYVPGLAHNWPFHFSKVSFFILCKIARQSDNVCLF